MTRAERFRTEEQRAAHQKKQKEAGTARKPRVAAASKLSHNEAPTRAQKSSYELETTGASSPSRKSTRKALNRQKTDSALRITAMVRNTSPPARAQAGRPRPAG